MPRELRWGFLGTVPYGPAVALQERLREELLLSRRLPRRGADTLLLLEHPHVYTLGRTARTGELVADPAWLRERGVDVAETNRGGRSTYHGPGQLVGYPIVDLDPDRRDVRRYVRDLEEVLVRTLADYGVAAAPRQAQPEIGVWVGERKIGSLGVHLRRWVATHGFALNVTTDLSFFSGIVPCGLEGVEMTSIAALTGRRPPLPEVAARCTAHFAAVFDRCPVEVPADQLRETGRPAQDDPVVASAAPDSG